MEVASIGNYAFSGCSALTSVNFIAGYSWYAGNTKIDGNYLHDSSIAAKYLTSTYCNCSWERA